MTSCCCRRSKMSTLLYVVIYPSISDFLIALGLCLGVQRRVRKSFSWPLFSVSASQWELFVACSRRRPEFAAMTEEPQPGLVSLGLNSNTPSPEMETEAIAVVQPQICGVLGNKKMAQLWMKICQPSPLTAHSFPLPVLQAKIDTVLHQVSLYSQSFWDCFMANNFILKGLT